MDSPWGPITVRDAHVHFFSRKFFDALAAQKGAPVDVLDDDARAAGIALPPADPADLAAQWVGELDRHGLDAAAIIASVPGDEQSVAAAVRVFPARFRGYFMVNPMADGALVRATAALDSGLRGMCFFPAMHRYAMADSGVEPFLALANNRRAVVFVHCGVLSVGVRGKLGLSSPFDLRFSNPSDLQAVAQLFPGARFVIPHFGAGYLREALMLASMCPNLYLDTSSTNRWMRFEGLNLETVMRRTIDVAGAHRVVFGSDSSFFPRGWVSHIYLEQARVLHQIGVSSEDATQIFGGNFSALFDSI